MLISAVCSDPVLARFIVIIKNGLSLIQVIVPILLIVAGSVELLKLVLNPDDKNGTKAIANSFAAAVIVFFLPYVVNLTMSIVSSTNNNKTAYGIYDTETKKTSRFDISSCWTAAEKENADNAMDSANDKVSSSVKES